MHKKYVTSAVCRWWLFFFLFCTLRNAETGGVQFKYMHTATVIFLLLLHGD